MIIKHGVHIRLRNSHNTKTFVGFLFLDRALEETSLIKHNWNSQHILAYKNSLGMLCIRSR